jgi:ATP-binding cassette subfamily F protein 3
MTVLLQLRNAHKRYGDQVLLDNAEVSLVERQKVAFIGRNGAGKSTLCRVLLGEEELEQGEIARHPRLRLGYLRQHDPFEPGEKVLEFLMRDSGQSDWKCGEIAGQFELKGPRLQAPIKELSGGWQTRVKLTALLLHEPNLLVLDEPTNFLDLRTQLLLEEFLKEFRAACLVVSHDRTFLNDVCSHTLDLSRGKLTMFSGKVDAFLTHQQERREHDRRTNAAIQSKRKHLEDFIDRNRARASTASQARSKSKQLERLQLVEEESQETQVRIRTPNVSPRKGPAVRCLDLSIGYPGKVVAEGIDLEIDHGSRMAVVGDNGQGKTTFVRSLVDSLSPIAGEVKWGYACEVGCYAQHAYTSLPESDTVLDYLRSKAASDVKSQEVLDVAGSFLFRGSHVEKKIGVLSGGERARLCLAGLLLGKHNILILDEPGNHLDVDSVEGLADALATYQGTVIFTSHDRHFLHRVANGVIEVRDGRVAKTGGDYEAYVYQLSREAAESHASAAAEAAAEKKAHPERKGDAGSKQRSAGELRDLKKELSAAEKSLAKMTEQRATLHAKFLTAADPSESVKLHSQLKKLDDELATVEERWLALHEELG